MRTVDRDLDRILTLLRHRLHQHGATQLEVQERLGWGRSYISQLLTEQKSLRVEQVLLILHVIGADPKDFWAEVYPPAPARATPNRPLPAAAPGDAAMREEHREMRTLLECTVKLLKEKEYISDAELAHAIRKAETS